MYDICFIGGGLNYAGAVVAAKAGMSVALIDRDLNLLGGTCLHRGCIPSKMFCTMDILVMPLRQRLSFQKKLFWIWHSFSKRRED